MGAGRDKGMNWRKLAFAILILLFGLLMLRRAGEAGELLATLRRGQPLWMLVAIGLQALTLLNQPALYQSLYEMLGLGVSWRELAPIVWAGHFVNAVTPSAGLGGTALLLDDARRRGLDGARVALANTLYFGLNFLWFALILAWSLARLFFWHHLTSPELAAAGILLVAVLIGLVGLIVVSWKPALFERIMSALGRGLSRLSFKLLRRQVLEEQALGEFGARFGESAQVLRQARSRLWRPWVHAMLVDGLEIAVLGACFAAFPSHGLGVGLSRGASAGEVSASIVIVGYAIGTLFLVVSITPQGLGVVEGVMTAIFVSLGIPLERAAAVVLVYRGLSFWLPLVVGLLVLRWTPNLRNSVQHPAPLAEHEPPEEARSAQ